MLLHIGPVPNFGIVDLVFTGSKPYDVVLGLLSIAFGTLVLLTYRYYLRYSIVSPEAQDSQRSG